MKKIEADRLLDLRRRALGAVFPDVPDPDIVAAPEIIHVLLLGGEQLLEPLGPLRDPSSTQHDHRVLRPKPSRRYDRPCIC